MVLGPWRGLPRFGNRRSLARHLSRLVTRHPTGALLFEPVTAPMDLPDGFSPQARGGDPVFVVKLSLPQIRNCAELPDGRHASRRHLFSLALWGSNDGGFPFWAAVI